MNFSDILMSAAVQGSGVASPYSPEAMAYFATMSPQPDDTIKGLLNTLINDMIANGWHDALDWYGQVVGADAQPMRVNAKTPAQIATESLAPVFTPNLGYAGRSGFYDLLETGIADNATTQNTQNSSTIFVWVNQLPIAAGTVIGTSVGAQQRISLSPGTSYNARVHTSATLTEATAPATGLYSASRTDANTVSLYYNGVLVETNPASASSATTANTFSFLGGGSSSSNARIAAMGFGAGRDAAAHAALFSTLNTYLTARGAN